MDFMNFRNPKLVVGRHGKVILMIFAISSAACFNIGCYAYRTIAVADRDDIDPSECIYKVETVDGDFIECRSDSLGCAALSRIEVRCVLEDSSVQTIPMEQVSRLYTKKPSTMSTIGNITLVTLGVGVFVYALHSIKF